MNNSVHLKINCNCNYSACTDKKLMRRVLSFITSLWSVGLRQISVLSVFRKMWCNSWCNTIFQKVFNAKYYTFAGLSTLNDCISIRLLWCNTPRKYYTCITPNSPKWCNTFKGITPHLTC